MLCQDNVRCTGPHPPCCTHNGGSHNRSAHNGGRRFPARRCRRGGLSARLLGDLSGNNLQTSFESSWVRRSTYTKFYQCCLSWLLLQSWICIFQHAPQSRWNSAHRTRWANLHIVRGTTALGNGVRVNTWDILLIRIAPKATYVSAEGRSAMGMETPGPTQNKWMEALSVQMSLLEPILCLAKQRNASVNRVQPRQP